MLDFLLPENLYLAIKKNSNIEEITEIRIRKGRKIEIKNCFRSVLINNIATKNDISEIIKRATRNSLYAYQDDIQKGFISYNGIRIGLAGIAVTNDAKLITIKDFSSLNIRIPHQVVGASQLLKNIINNFNNTIVISPPYGGKTTLIRDIARELSNSFDTLIVDERFEIYNDSYTFGEKIDVIQGASKYVVVEGLIRALSPEIIVLDELFGNEDLRVIEEITRSGIKVLASIHGESVEKIRLKYETLLNNFDYAIELGNKPKVGTIKSIVRLKC